jgi:hypothetical protein
MSGRHSNPVGTMPRKLLATATVAVALASGVARADEPVPDDEMLEFLGSIDALDDEEFLEYLADVDVRRVAKGEKPGLPRLDAKTNKPAPPSKPEKPAAEQPKGEDS